MFIEIRLDDLQRRKGITHTVWIRAEHISCYYPDKDHITVFMLDGTKWPITDKESIKRICDIVGVERCQQE